MSVASLSIANLEDSEGLVRAFRKKKTELDQLRESHYALESEHLQTKQQVATLQSQYTQQSSVVAQSEGSRRQ